MRLTRLFAIATIALFALIAAMLAWILASEWRTYRASEEGLHALHIAYKAMIAAEKASMERGPANGVLGDEDPPDRAKRENLQKARDATNTALQEVLDTGGNDANPRIRASLEALHRAQNALAAARNTVDQVGSTPRARRESDLIMGAVHQMFAVIPQIMEAVSRLSAIAEETYPELSASILDARLAAELREHAGRLGSHFTGALTERRPLRDEERAEVRESRGRIEQLRSLLHLATVGADADPRVAAAARTMEEEYFHKAMSLVTRLEVAQPGSAALGMSTAAFAAQYVPRMNTMLALRDALVTTAAEQARHAQAHAGSVLAWSTAIGVAALLLTAGIFLLLLRRIVQPVISATRVLGELSKGNLQIEVPQAGSDEIGEMLKAVALLRENSLERQQLQRKVRKRTQALAERETLLSTLLESSPSGLLLGTEKGETRLVSRKWSELQGYSLDDLQSMSLRELYVDAKDRKAFLAALARDGKVRDFECRFRRKDGSEFWGLLNSSCVQVGGESLIATWVHDVSDRKAADARIAGARAQLQAMMDGTPALMFMKDLKGRYQRVNRAFADFVGLEIWQIIGHTDRDLYPPDAAAAIEAEDRRVRDLGETVQVEHSIALAGRAPRDFLRYKFPLRDEKEQIYALAGVATDITERKKAEREVAELSAFLKAMTDSMPYPMFYNGPDTRFLGCNKAYENVFGIQREHLVGKRVVELDLKFLNEKQRHEYQAELERIAAEGLTVRREAVFPFADGTPHHTLYSVSGFRKPDGAAGGLVGVFVDIEPLKAAERALNEALESQKAVLETSPHGIAVVRERTYVQTNSSLERIFGYAPGEMVGMPTRDTYESDAVYRDFGERAYKALQNGATFADEFRLVRKDGSRFWGRITAAALDQSDPLKGTLGIYEDVTEAHDAAEALKRALDRQGTIFAASPHGIALVEERRFAVASANLERMFGYGPGEMQDRSTRMIFESDEQFDRIGAVTYSALQSGKPHSEEARLVRKDGSQFWCRITVAALDRADPTHGVVGIYEDVSEAHEAAESLRQALARQQAIFAASPFGIATFQNRKFTLASPALERMFGYAPGEMIGESSRAIYASDEEWDRIGSELYATLRSGAATHVQESQFVRKDGSRFWGRITAAAMDRGDPLAGLIAMYEDITERKRAEEALRAAHSEQHAIFESATSGIALIRDRVIQRCNRKLEEVFGYEAGALVGKSTRVWYQSDEEGARGGAAVYEQIWKGETHRREQQFVRKDGTLFWCRLTGRAVDPADRSKGTVWMLEDVTEERAAADALRAARQAAEEATQAKSMFLANMSHEIRTPMNAVIGMSHLALKTDLNPRQRDYVQKIHNAGTSLLGIINDILDFSKIEAGKLDMESVDFSLDEVLANLATIVGQKVADKGLELLIDVPAGLTRDLIGDPLRFGQILVNLVNNAVKFTERGEISLRVHELERTGDKVKLQLGVRDTGIGMTREQCGRLFQAFSQADGSTTRKYGGTGLGLTICKRLVEMMGGTIWVESEPGAGSHFQFTAWFGRSAKRHLRARVVPEALNGLRVLVADDSAAARDVILDALADKPFEVRAVDSGEAAIAAVEAASAAGNPVDLVFMDWRMGGISGAEAALRIKEHQGLRQVPRIVMVTAFGRDEVREEASRAHVDGFLVKPVTGSTLVDTVVGLFAKDEAARAPAAAAPEKSWGLRGARVLLAEDNEINQQIAVELLESEGVAVDIATNGRQAVDRLLAARDSYDAVLMDLQMPGMGGIEAAQEIRKHVASAAVPIIAMTAHAMAEERERCLDAGMQDHVTKPIDPDTLYRTLAAWCRPKASARVRDGMPDAAAAVLDVPAIEGLDTVTGLKRVAGNRKLYLKLLRQYADGQSGAAESIRRNLQAGDRRTAERIAHTAKGVSGNIGADGVQDAAALLEQAIQHGAETESLLAAFERALGAMIERLNAKLTPREVAAAPLQPIDAARLREVLARLAALLGESDGEAVRLLSAEASVLRPALGADFHALEKAVNDFDFDSALAKLKTSAGQHNLSL